MAYVDIDLKIFHDDDLIEELIGRGYEVSEKSENGEDVYKEELDIDDLIAQHHYNNLSSDELVKKLYDYKDKCWCKP